jgi:hypothetical protein
LDVSLYRNTFLTKTNHVVVIVVVIVIIVVVVVIVVIVVVVIGHRFRCLILILVVARLDNNLMIKTKYDYKIAKIGKNLDFEIK